MSATATMAPEGARPRRRLVGQLWFWVVIAIALGIVFGLVAPDAAKQAKWLADAFIQLIKTVTGPVIFVTVVIGIASLGNLARAGGLALRALGYFFCATVVALDARPARGQHRPAGRGLLGVGRARPAARRRRSRSARRARDSGVVAFITGHLLPTSFLQPFVDNEILADPRPRPPHRGGDLDARRRAQRERIVGVFEVASRVIFGDHPADHVGRAARRVRRHGVHRRAVRRRVAGAASALLMVTFWGTCAIFVFGVLGARRAAERLQHLQARPAASRTSC